MIAYKQLGLSMDIATKVVQHVSSPKESNLHTLHTYSIFENIVFLVFFKYHHRVIFVVVFQTNNLPFLHHCPCLKNKTRIICFKQNKIFLSSLLFGTFTEVEKLILSQVHLSRPLPLDHPVVPLSLAVSQSHLSPFTDLLSSRYRIWYLSIVALHTFTHTHPSYVTLC